MSELRSIVLKRGKSSAKSAVWVHLASSWQIRSGPLQRNLFLGKCLSDSFKKVSLGYPPSVVGRRSDRLTDGGGCQAQCGKRKYKSTGELQARDRQ